MTIRGKSEVEILNETIEDLTVENNGLYGRIKELNLIIDYLREENKNLMALYEVKTPKERVGYFIIYICNYYKVKYEDVKGGSRKGILPYCRQIICYFLRESFGYTINEVSNSLVLDTSTVQTSIKKIKETIDRDVIKDVLIHREWLNKLNKI